MSNTQLFELEPKSGAKFSKDGQFRYSLWRIWDNSKPMVMFIGLNPSKANETQNDPTIESVIRICKYNGYGGVYMMNIFPFIATKPKDLLIDSFSSQINMGEIINTARECKDVVFAWGSVKKLITKSGINMGFTYGWTDPKCIAILKDGSPRHPLYCKGETTLIPYR